MSGEKIKQVKLLTRSLFRKEMWNDKLKWTHLEKKNTKAQMNGHGHYRKTIRKIRL